MSNLTDDFGIPLLEMARIGNKDQYSFWVYTEPLKNPSFHLKHKTDFEIVLQIKDYKILEIKHNQSTFEFKKNELPPKSILDVVNEFMDAPNARKPNMANQDVLELFWYSINEDQEL